MSGRGPEVETLCPGCEAPAVLGFPRDGDAWTCGTCGACHPLVGGVGLNAGETVSSCAACGCPKLFVQKDFNRNLGLAVVAATAVVSGIVLLVTRSTLWAMAVLGLVTLADALVYRSIPTVTVCYRCDSVHRGFRRNPDHQGFDIHAAEEFAYGEK